MIQVSKKNCSQSTRDLEVIRQTWGRPLSCSRIGHFRLNKDGSLMQILFIASNLITVHFGNDCFARNLEDVLNRTKWNPLYSNDYLFFLLVRVFAKFTASPLSSNFTKRLELSKRIHLSTQFTFLSRNCSFLFRQRSKTTIFLVVS